MVTPREVALDTFIKVTDRKSLHTYIGNLVKTAQATAAKQLDERRAKLRRMLEYEDKIYEAEFSDKVKSRIDEDIRKRKDELLKIKEAHDEQERKFLEQKVMQQQFESCHEIRDALRRKYTLETKEAQLEQITENERALNRRRQIDEYWRQVRDVGAQQYDKRQAEEQRLKGDLQRQVSCVLDEQMAMHQRQAEEQRAAKRREAEELAKVMEEIRLEEFDRMRLGVPEKTLAYRKELLDVIAQNQKRREADNCQRAEEHRELMRQVAAEECEYSEAVTQRKRAVYNATIEYLDYVRRMRKLAEDEEKAREARIDDLRHVDICTKSNLQQEAKRKAELAALCYAELRRQICEEYDRRLREVQEQREPKIIENRFARPEKTRADMLAERRKMRQELDEQLSENARIRAEEEAQYNAELQKALKDTEFCAQLAEKYVRGGVDYLPPHPNWLKYACPQKAYVAKQMVAVNAAHAGAGDQPAIGGDDGQVENACIKPCGCDSGGQFERLLGSKRGAYADQRLLEKETC